MSAKRPLNILRRRMNSQSSNFANFNLNDDHISYLIDHSTRPQDWHDHLEKDLMKFWDAPVLNDIKKDHIFKDLFMTYLDNKGNFIPEDSEFWPEEYKQAYNDKSLSGLVEVGTNYVRAHSRQTYAYGIAYHMTGKKEYLDSCIKGVGSLITAMDANNGMFTKQNADTGEWLPRKDERTSQDLAYGLTGLSMYYYLTHDENILPFILQTKDYIFNTYFDIGKGYLTWHPKYLVNEKNDVEIVAQLDQMYAYMLFLIPSLPEPYQSQWKCDLKMLVDILFHRFYSQRFEFFWGVDSSSTDHRLGIDHTDFGHSVKTMWNIYRAGVLLKDSFYIMFAREKIDKILKEAFIAETGSWARRYDENGNIDENKEWWIFAELDQAAALLALNDPTYLEYLNPAHKYWKDYMVDKQYGEIWHMVDAVTNKPIIKYPKIHNWKTSLHSFEHALFNYMTSSQIHDLQFDTYYAFKSEQEICYGRISPYMFEGNIKNVEFVRPLGSPGMDAYKIFKVSYDNIR